MALLGGFAVPGDRLLRILRDAFTVGVHGSKVGLGPGMALLGGFAVPGDRLLRILRDAFTVGVHATKVELGLSIPMFGHSLNCH